MKFRKTSYGGDTPISTQQPLKVVGGFNLDTSSQSFNEKDVISAGTPCVFNEQTRKVNVLKTGKVTAINALDAKIVTLGKSKCFVPIFKIGDRVFNATTGTYASAPAITAISETETGYIITLDAAISGLAVNDIINAVSSVNSTTTTVAKEVTVSALINGNAKGVTVVVNPSDNPVILQAGDKLIKKSVLNATTAYNAATIFTVDTYNRFTGELIMTADVSAAWAADDELTQVFDGGAPNNYAVPSVSTTTAMISTIEPNALVIEDVTIENASDSEIGIDVTINSGNGEFYARRIAPIPSVFLSEDKMFLAKNSNIKFTQSK